MNDDKPETIEPEKLESPLKPLLWVLIPFVLILLYGFFSR